ncbi:16S rRNA (guanine(527)-N(7))-methyltransferase RsmG [Micropruina sp.]|uniref:16S rRNA (guanine(527)-N(7))-methyltransferase RsmG n=1 Tax=Micropruina sp. TaxID=2737536 RepID=UPI0039E47F70
MEHEVFGDSYEQGRQYVDILASRGVDWGLIGPREVDRLWSRHVLNSVAIEQLINHGSSVLDVGSGAGLPGIPLAILRPDLTVTLLEPLLRRANFLTEVVDELGLAERVSVVRGRAEDQDQTYQVVTCRAVAALPKLLTWCLPLVAPHGQLLAIKGESAEQELIDVQGTLRKRRLTGQVLSVAAHTDAEPTWVVRIR